MIKNYEKYLNMQLKIIHRADKQNLSFKFVIIRQSTDLGPGHLVSLK